MKREELIKFRFGDIVKITISGEKGYCDGICNGEYRGVVLEKANNQGYVRVALIALDIIKQPIGTELTIFPLIDTSNKLPITIVKESFWEYIIRKINNYKGASK